MDLVVSLTAPSGKRRTIPTAADRCCSSCRVSTWARSSMSRTPAWRARWKSAAVYTAAICAGAHPLTGAGGGGATGFPRSDPSR